MHPHRPLLVPLAAGAACLFAGACATTPDTAPSNEALVADFQSRATQLPEEYETDVHLSPDEQGVSLDTVVHISSTLTESYHRDVERCLEQEMERLENRFVAGEVVLQVHVNTQGKVHKAAVAHGALAERRTPNGEALPQPGRTADQFHECFATVATTWEFSRPPEVDYVHTYAVTLGEAW